jgi:hypothetical protein
MCRFWRKERENYARFFCGDVEKLVARIDAPSGEKRMDGALAREGVCDLHCACDDVRVRWAPCVTGIRLIEALCGASPRRSYFDKARHRWRFEGVNPSGHDLREASLVFCFSSNYIFLYSPFRVNYYFFQPGGMIRGFAKKTKHFSFEFSFSIFFLKRIKGRRLPKKQSSWGLSLGAVGLKKGNEKK